MDSPIRRHTFEIWCMYFGHITQRNPEILEELLVAGKEEGKRPRVRSPIRWANQISRLGTPFHIALHHAADRSRLRNVMRDKIFRGSLPKAVRLTVQEELVKDHFLSESADL
ncbi:jg9063 [Pararge aegeria aegeria]|uniref:Jg9063 protein n=1 Tax=Pararge aegeria aegeria TaxID=348720 RepID=A0A8S4RWZ8_9NEOP|nr:jg9063 [Pararge aegeria aegeria]